MKRALLGLIGIFRLMQMSPILKGVYFAISKAERGGKPVTIGFCGALACARSILKAIQNSLWMGSTHLAIFIARSIFLPATMSLFTAFLFARKATKHLDISKTLPLCLYVLAAQSSRDYTAGQVWTAAA